MDTHGNVVIVTVCIDRNVDPLTVDASYVVRGCRGWMLSRWAMKISHDGDRLRFYAERKQLEVRQGNPIHEGVSETTRRRIVRELGSRSGFRDKSGNWVTFQKALIADLNRVFIKKTEFYTHNVESYSAVIPLDEFLQIVELGVARIVRHRQNPAVDIAVIQSLLADDLTAFRLVNVGTATAPRIQVQRIDNQHLHAVVTDRTFELTRIAEFASAQGDYADSWKHYSTGNLDDALTNAHKAVESACKTVVKKADPASTPNDLQLGPLVALLVQHQIIPDKLTHVCGQLEQIFRNAGTLRNQPGAAHGTTRRAWKRALHCWPSACPGHSLHS
jgi:hypothetical protein